MLTFNGIKLGARLTWAVLAICLPAPPAFAQGAPEAWRATALNERWDLKQWSSACGPKPRAAAVGAADVTITRRGGELYFVEAGRQYSTNHCWERYPGLNRTEHRAGNGSWSNLCRTRPDDPRQATVRTSVSASSDRITWHETGEYRLSIQGAQCYARVTRTRAFARKPSPTGPAPTAAPLASPPDTSPDAPAQHTQAGTRGCAEPGEPARLAVSPALLWAPPAGELALQATVYDGNGCPLSIPVRWKPHAQAPLSVTSGGLVSVAADAAPGEYPIVISTASGVRASLRFHIVAPNEVDRFLNQQQSHVHPAMHLPGPASETRSVGATAAEAENHALRRKRWFVAIGVGISLLLGGLGVVLLRQQAPSRQRRRSADAPLTPRPTPPPAPGPRRRCPACGQVYANGAIYCGIDGHLLQPE